MKDILKLSSKLYIRLIVISFLCFFIIMTIFAFGNSILSDTVGERVVGTKDGNSQTLYVHYYADGEDTRQAEYEEQGYEISRVTEKAMSAGDNTVTIIVAQLFSLGILTTFVYPYLWERGNKDINMVKIGKRQEDKLLGLKVGITASVPSLLAFLGLAFTKTTLSKGLMSSVYYVVNICFFPLYKLVIEGAGQTVMSGNVANSDLAFWQLLIMFLLLLVLPATSAIGYYLGYKDISLGEKFIYKKKQGV